MHNKRTNELGRAIKTIVPIWPEIVFHSLAEMFQVDEFTCWLRNGYSVSVQQQIQIIVHTVNELLVRRIRHGPNHHSQHAE